MFAQLYFYIFAQFLVLLDNHCNADPVRGKNVELAKKGEFPFIVSLSKTCNFVEKENHYCGGALISNKHVLTAAHCIPDDLRCMTVIINSIDFESGKIREVEACKKYDEWAHEHYILPEYADNDIAIITLSQIVNGTQPARISTLTRDQVIGKDVVTAGWGFLNNSRSSRPDILRKVHFKVLTEQEFNENAIEIFGFSIPMPLNIYSTAAKPPAVATLGDSGGPLLLASNNEIVGINDSGTDSDDVEINPYAMTFHRSVDYYRRFINAVVTSGK